jgi:hypothetical protein
MCYEDDRVPAIRESPQKEHHPLVSPRIESRRRLNPAY